MNTASKDKTLVWETRSVAETIELGKKLGRLLTPGCVVGLVGQLGAGKTYLTKGMALGAGVPDEHIVTSPTFVLVNSYQGKYPIKHVDYYRLDRPDEIVNLGWYDFLKTDIVICEWADKVTAHLGPDHLVIAIEIIEESRRRFAITAVGSMSKEILSQMNPGRE